MKALQEIMKYVHNIDPCGDESVCLVRAGCRLLQDTPWRRTTDCPEYIAFSKRRDLINKIKVETIDTFWTITMLGGLLFLAFLFILGIITFVGFFI